MKTSPPVLLFTLALLLVSEAWQGPSNLACVYDSMETVTCNWTHSRNATEAQCTLTGHAESEVGTLELPVSEPESSMGMFFCPDFAPEEKIFYQPDGFQLDELPPQTCQLRGVGTVMRSCKLIFDEKTYALTVSDAIRLAVSCHPGENWRPESRHIKPFENLQLRPPHSVQMESDKKPSYNLTWQLLAFSHYLKGKLEYEVGYRKANDPDKAATILPVTYDQQWIEIENLSPGTEYEAAVRVKVQDYTSYKSIWSHWSTTIKWRTYPKEPSSFSFLPVLLAFGISSISIFLIAAVLLVKTRMPKWLQKMLKIHLPDPLMFFPSLTAVHRGDIQEWLSSPLSMDSFHIAAASPDVSVLEVLQKGSQDPCLLLPKECLTPVDAPEISGHSSSSCFVNRGYFFFHHLHSVEIEPCKVYFTYDPVAQENSSSEDGDSYQALHTTVYHPPLPSYSLVGSEEGVSLLPEMKEPTQKVHQTISSLSTGRSPPALATEQGETQEEREAISPVFMGVSSVHEQPSSNANKMEAIKGVATHAGSIGNNMPLFLQPMVLNPGNASDICITESSSQVPNSEAYLSLRELQSQYNHQTV